MSTIIIKKLSKDEVLGLLDDMFNIISENMKDIVDTFHTNEENYNFWKKSMYHELENNNKRWVGAFKEKKLIGYFLYKIDNNILYLDEIQIIRKHQGDKYTFKNLLKTLLEEPELTDNYLVRAYVNKNNEKSRNIIKKIGFKILEEKENGIVYVNSYKIFRGILKKQIL